jgi:adenylate kinase family enzyme
MKRPMTRPMKRIAVVGCSGAGKSTFSRLLGARLGLPVVHLDVLFWRPGWVESDAESFRERVGVALGGEEWITDGNFTAVADLTLARCDTIIWLEQPMLKCLWRAARRAVRERGLVRADMAAGCAEKIDLALWGYIWTWRGAPRRRLEAAIATHGAAAGLIKLEGDRAATEFLASLGS